MDFHGGLFHFQEGLQTTILPERGDVLIYRAEEVHCVDEIVQGERCTLALWFTKDSSCDEDAKILNSIGLHMWKSPLQFHATIKEKQNESVWMPVPPSSSMHIVEFRDVKRLNAREEHRTIHSDLRISRLAALGLNLCFASEDSLIDFQEIDACCDKTFSKLQDALEKTVMLKLNEELLPYVFANSIHALQVLYFCKWKESDQQESGTKSEAKQQQEYPAESMAESASKVNFFHLHFREWEKYMSTHYESLQRSFPIWNQFRRISAISSEP